MDREGNLPKLEPRFFNAQDDIDHRREQLIAEIEGKLHQRVTQTPVFSIRWGLAMCRSSFSQVS